jgi:hypothetical protein
VHFPRAKAFTSNVGSGVTLHFAAVSDFIVRVFKFDEDWVVVKEMLAEIDEIDKENDEKIATLEAILKEDEPRAVALAQLRKEAGESFMAVQCFFWWSLGFNLAVVVAYLSQLQS